ncbi:MAG TPA: hypothetical protein VG346_11760 [Acidimicrobiales bacterium]|jgi:hypothetical protein|nr:hypothetical protein [Acidimicrobiales bacterium]
MVTGQLVNVAGGAAVALAVSLALMSTILIVLVIVIVANRAEPDPRGMRPHTVYLFGMSFVTLQLSYAGSILIVTALFSLIAPHYGGMGDQVAREVVIGALLAALFGGVWVVHLRRGIQTANGDEGTVRPNTRVMNSYAGVVGFIYLLQLVVTFGAAVYLLLALIAPGVFGSVGSSRSGTLAILLDLVYIMVASAVVLMIHANLGPSVFPPRPGAQAVAPGTAPAPTPAPVPPAV